MDKYKFWIILILIITCGIVIVSGIFSWAWVNSPTVWTVEFGFDDESLQVMNSTLDLAESIDSAVDMADEYKEDINGVLDEIQ